MSDPHQAQLRRGLPAPWRAAAVWVAGWLAMWALDGHIDLANLGMILILTCALAALWLPLAASMLSCAAAVLVFNFAFVPPRGAFAVDLQQHALLLLTMLAVSWIVSLLMARQRQLATSERHSAMRTEQLHTLCEALREAEDPRQAAVHLREALSQLTGTPATLLIRVETPSASDDGTAAIEVGEATPDERAGLWLSLRLGRPMGPGTGRHEEQPAWYLPLRGRHGSLGTALVPVPLAHLTGKTTALLSHAQAMCDQMGLALERHAATQAAAASRDEAHAQQLNNTLLAAISHDYRTPLATILGAASSLLDQGDRLSAGQQRRLAAVIVDEAGQLARLTDNTLQLARLGAPGMALHLEWESAEEIVGTVLRRCRQRDCASRVKARVEPGLPLLRCDAVLLVQLLDNLVDNALKYGGDAAPVEILVRRIDDRVVLAVRDRGRGVSAAWRERIFTAFQRGEPARDSDAAGEAARRGAGVGLAVCRAIARANGGELTLRSRSRGGSSFECALPVIDAPVEPHRERSGAVP